MVTGASVGRPFALHVEDPPRSVFGLPRIIKSIDDHRRVLDIVDSVADGLTLRSGTLGSDLRNDVPSFIKGLRPLRPHAQHHVSAGLVGRHRQGKSRAIALRPRAAA